MCRLYLMSVYPPSNHLEHPSGHLTTPYQPRKMDVCANTPQIFFRKMKCQNLFDSYTSLFRHNVKDLMAGMSTGRPTKQTKKIKSKSQCLFLSSIPHSCSVGWEKGDGKEGFPLASLWSDRHCAQRHTNTYTHRVWEGPMKHRGVWII